MQGNTKLLTLESKNIFLQNSFSLVLQFPFENSTTVEKLKQILAKQGFAFQKISKSALHRQLAQVNVDFVPTLGANFVLTKAKAELNMSTWKEVFLLIHQHKATFLFLQITETKNQNTVWYDANRILKQAELLEQPPFSSQLLHFLRKQTVLPLLASPGQKLLFLLDLKRHN
jgi:hypothetical protein